ncbi:MAG: LytTR family DNA-binding domain-containing protein [Lachnospiraceae bacterium]|nr:LytTR family DNA-binding domain-containing protein [Lachnospiraceae bacterium]
MRIGICDDEKDAILAAEKIIKSMEVSGHQITLIPFENSDSVVEDILAEQLDIMLLDIDMPGRNGIEIGDAIAMKNQELNLIFLTNRADMVFRAIYCHPYRFIRKSHMETELPEALESVAQKLSNEQFLFEFHNKNESLKVRIKDILYIDSDKHYIQIHEEDKMHRVRGKLSAYEDRLKEYGFIRIHIGYLVNVRFIYRMTASIAELDNGKILPISRKYSTSAREEYNIGMGRFVNGIRI